MLYTFLRRRSPLILLLLSLTSLLAVAGCTDDQNTLARIQEDSYVQIGFANEPPYGYATTSGEVTGEAPEVAKEILSRMGIDQVDGVVVPFSSLIPGLQAGRFDMIAAGMFINPDRCDDILFSDPDYVTTTSFAVPSGNPSGIQNYEDVANSEVQLGVMSGAVEQSHAEAKNVPESQMTTFDNAASMAEALVGGRVDAISLTTLSLQAQLDRLDANEQFDVTTGFLPVIDGEERFNAGGYGFSPDDEEFRDEFNRILNEMQDNNEIVPITEEFGFGPEAINGAKDLTAEQLCEE